MHKTKILGMAAVVSFLISHTAAFAVNLPATANFTVAAGANSTYAITLANVDAGYDIANGTYPGWTVTTDPQPPLPNQIYSGWVSASADWLPWDLISFVLNNKGGASPADVQAAITSLSLSIAIDPNAQPIAAQLVFDAQNFGVGFSPGPDDIVPVLIEWYPPSEAATIIELAPAPETCMDRFSACGSILQNHKRASISAQGGRKDGVLSGSLVYVDCAARLLVHSTRMTNYVVISPTCREATYVLDGREQGIAVLRVCDGVNGAKDSVDIVFSNGYAAGGDLCGKVQLVVGDCPQPPVCKPPPICNRRGNDGKNCNDRNDDHEKRAHGDRR
jgi:hypothetical protein